MRRRWYGKDISLRWLYNLVEGFFQSREFKTKINESSGRHTLSALPPKGSAIKEAINLEISIDPDGLEIDFIAGGKADSSIKYGMLTTLFGGGGMLLRGLRSQEAIDRLENDFWVYLSEKMELNNYLKDQ